MTDHCIRPLFRFLRESAVEVVAVESEPGTSEESSDVMLGRSPWDAAGRPDTATASILHSSRVAIRQLCHMLGQAGDAQCSGLLKIAVHNAAEREPLTDPSRSLSCCRSMSARPAPRLSLAWRRKSLAGACCPPAAPVARPRGSLLAACRSKLAKYIMSLVLAGKIVLSRLPCLLLAHLIRVQSTSGFGLRSRIQLDASRGAWKLSHTHAMERLVRAPLLASHVPALLVASVQSAQRGSLVQFSVSALGVRADLGAQRERSKGRAGMSWPMRISKSAVLPLASKDAIRRLAEYGARLRKEWTLGINQVPVQFPPPPSLSSLRNAGLLRSVDVILRYVVDAQVAGLEGLLRQSVSLQMLQKDILLRIAEQVQQVVDGGLKVRCGVSSRRGLFLTLAVGSSWIQLHVMLVRGLLSFDVTFLSVLKLYSFACHLPDKLLSAWPRLFGTAGDGAGGMIDDAAADNLFVAAPQLL